MSRMTKYKCYKEVEAAKISNIVWCDTTRRYMLVFENKSIEPVYVETKYIAKHEPQVGGYYVRYKDGYESWSPADVFESGYELMEKKRK